MINKNVATSRVVVACLIAGGLMFGALKYWIQSGLHEKNILKVASVEIAMRSVLTSVTHAGRRIVAVGENGIIIFSDDDGNSWREAKTQFKNTLTSVRFSDERNGVAVGHQGGALRTDDAGETWSIVSGGNSTETKTVQSVIPPLLDIQWIGSTNAITVGAFGEALITNDLGRTWTDYKSELPNSSERHLYAVAKLPNSTLFVGELGTIIVHDDATKVAGQVKAPYTGTFFGAHATKDNHFMVFGLGGMLFRSNHQGLLWERCKVATEASITAMEETEKGDLLLANMKGEIFIAKRGTCSFEKSNAHYPGPISGLALIGEQQVIAVGVRGVSAPMTFH